MAPSQAPPSLGFSRQEYWSGLPLPSLCLSESVSILKISPFVSYFKYKCHHIFFSDLYWKAEITLPTKVRLVKAMVFPVVMYGCELDCEECWAPKNRCFWTVVLEKTLESPLDCKEIRPVHSEGDQPWDFFGRNEAKAETPVLWPPHAKSWLIGKDSDAGSYWGQEEKRTTEDEMAGWYYWLDGREAEWTPGVGDGQGGLACCDSCGRKESDTTEQLNWTEWLLKSMINSN